MCHECSRTERERNAAAQRELRARRRTAWNDKLRRHGFRWRRTDTGWLLLHAVTGEPVAEDQAAAIIDRREEHQEFARETGRWNEPPF